MAIEVDHPARINSVIRGDLIGTGAYLLESRDHQTHVRFSWYVSTTRPWMNSVAGFAKPLLVWAHHSVMREGCAAMAEHLGTRLVSTSSSLVETPTAVAAAG